MAIQIDTDSAPLSDDDREYLLSRGRRHLVLQNDRKFKRGDFQESPAPAPQEPETAETDADPEWEAQVKELTVAELRDELTNRSLDATGNKDVLQKRLIEAGPES